MWEMCASILPTRLTVSLHSLNEGVYTVTWKAVSAVDGHQTVGTFPFAVGNVTRFTNIEATALFASISPDKRFLASYSGNGLFVMNPDGTNLTLLIPGIGGIPGTVNWIP